MLNWQNKRTGLRRCFQPALHCALVLSLASCAALKPAPAPRDTFEISAPQSFSNLPRMSHAQILIKVPTALKSIDSDRMIFKPSATIITYVAGAQWSDTVPRMVQAKLVEAFENTRATGATAKPGDGLVIDYQLVTDLRRFEIFNKQAVIEMSVKILSDKTGLVRQTRIFNVAVNVHGQTANAYVDGFNKAFDKLTRQLVRWTAKSI